MPCSRLYASGQAVLPRCPDQTCRQRVRSRWSLGWRRLGYSRTCRPGIVYVLQGTITDHRDGIATERCRRRRSRSTSSGSNRRAAAEPAVSNAICRDLPCASFQPRAGRGRLANTIGAEGQEPAASSLMNPKTRGKTWRNSREPRMSAGRSGLPSDVGDGQVYRRSSSSGDAVKGRVRPGRRPVSL
jgi:hypothetical protein